MKVLYSATILLFVCVVGCKNDKQSSGGIVTLDVEAAINNQCQFSLCDIAEDIELIALDSPNTKSLVGDIITLDSYITSDLSVMIGPLMKFYAKPGISRGKNALQITSLVGREE